MSSKQFMFLVILSFSFHQPARADNVIASNTSRALSPADLPPAQGKGVIRRLGIREAVLEALQNNLDVAITRDQKEIAKLEIQSSLSAFEPSLFARFSRNDRNEPPLDAQEGAAGSRIQSKDDSWSFGLGKRFITGTQLTLSSNTDRSDSNSGKNVANTGTAAGTINNLIFRSGVSIDLNQPLLKGFSLNLDVPKADVIRAEISSENARLETQQVLLQTVLNTENTYWDLVEAISAFQVQKQSLELAKKQYELTKRQIGAGISPPSDLLGADSLVASRKLALVSAERNIELTSNRLRELLNLPLESWKRPILPTDQPNFQKLSVKVDEQTPIALAHRPEWSQFANEAKRANLDLKVAKNNRMPTLDLGFNYRLTGQDPQYSSTINQLVDTNARAWTVSLILEWQPLGKAARANIATNKRRQHQLKLNMEKFLLGLHREIASAVLTLETAKRSVEAAQHFLEVALKSLDAEERRYMNGTSSNFIVGQRQEELANAKQSEIVARIQYEKAKTNLEFVNGTLLNKRNVEIEVYATPQKR